MKCKDCKFFTPNQCYTTPENSGYGHCSSGKLKYEKSDGKTDNAVYSDHEGYSAGIDVGEDFGCIHFLKH